MTEDLVLADRVICMKQQLLDSLHENASIYLTYVSNFLDPYQLTNITFWVTRAADSGFSMGGLATNFDTKSERMTVSCRVTWSWSERVNLHSRQMILARNIKTYATQLGFGTLSGPPGPGNLYRLPLSSAPWVPELGSISALGQDLSGRGEDNMLFADTPSTPDSDVPACRLFRDVVLPLTVRSISHRHFTVHWSFISVSQIQAVEKASLIKQLNQ